MRYNIFTMDLRPISEKGKSQYNKIVTHVMQSWEWGEFRKNLGTKVLRFGLYKNNQLNTAFQITFHKLPFINKYVGYLPKGPFPDYELAQALKKIGRENNCILIKVEPNIENHNQVIDKSFTKSPKPYFTNFNFLLDLTPTEETLLKNMSSKTRYNIKVAQKHGVTVEQRSDDQALEIYLKLHFDTTRRQGFKSHTLYYHKLVFKLLKEKGAARILIAFYTPPDQKTQLPLTAWMLFNFKNTLYYPYGGSSVEYKNVMANNLTAWEAIRLGKRLKLKQFDMWGALGPNPDPKDPWLGFHNFKKGYGGRLVQYLGTYDLVLNQPLYLIFTAIDKLMPLKLFLLKLLSITN